MSLSTSIEEKVGRGPNNVRPPCLCYTRIIEVVPRVLSTYLACCRVVSAIQRTHVVRDRIQVVVNGIRLILESEYVLSHVKALHRIVDKGRVLHVLSDLGVHQTSYAFPRWTLCC